MKIIKVFWINVIILLFLFLFLEGLSRIFYPEFNNQVFVPKEKSSGKNIKMDNHFGYEYRVRNLDEKFDHKNKNLILIAGDSITRGYGLDYEDIYWVETERFINEIRKQKIKIFASPNFGSAILQQLEKTKSFIENVEKEKKIQHFIYQFNYNDIQPKKVIIKAKKKFKSNTQFFLFNSFRYKYLNRSTFLRLLQHHAGSFKIKTTGDCLNRGLDALWRYSWVFGSEIVKEESEQLWDEFEDNLINMKLFLKRKKIKFSVLIVPTLLQVDPKDLLGQNYLNLDLSCKTIEPTNKLISILNRSKISFVLTDNKIKNIYKNKFINQNSESFFFAGDYNHFNSRASLIVAHSLTKHLLQSLK